MNAGGVLSAVAFNLLFNAIGSFLLAAAFTSIAERSLGIPGGRWKQLFLLMPLVKIAWDLARGIPSDSFLWAKLAGSRQDLGRFQLGFGLSPHGPVIRFALGALKSGLEYPQSAAELAATLLARKVTTRAPGTLALAAVAIALILLAVRGLRAIQAMLRAASLLRSARVVGVRTERHRQVNVVVADDYDGVPFLGGLSRSFVCFSRVVHQSLTPPELDAVVKHELGHLAHRDLWLFAAVALFADVFWFVPTLRGRCRAIVAEAEVCADQWALSDGASAVALAAALVRVAELSRFGVAPGLGLACTEPLLARRVRALVHVSATPSLRKRWGASGWKLGATLLLLATILNATAFGNH